MYLISETLFSKVADALKTISRTDPECAARRDPGVQFPAVYCVIIKLIPSNTSWALPRGSSYIHRTSGKEPVPWAETYRSSEQAIHFHVDPSYPLEDFQKDWTAAHEISHLSIPFVGMRNMWFSEGYASYWQWQILHQQGIYSIKEIQKKYQAKLDKIKPSYNTNESFIETSKKLKANYNYPALYWGGACYFFQADSLLKKEYDTSLEDVIQRYQTGGRMTDKNLDDLINSLDHISNSQVFSELLHIFQNETARAAVYPTVLSFNE